MSHLADLTPCDGGVLDLYGLIEFADAKAAQVRDLPLGLSVLADNLGYFKLCHILILHD